MHTPTAAPPSAQPPVLFTCSSHFLAWLHDEQISLAATTYQTNRLLLFGLKEDGALSAFERLFDRPMGLHATPERLTLATRYQIWQFDDALPPDAQHEGYDRLYVPRRATTTGELDVHDLAVDAEGRVVFVNTVYSCLATLSERHSFEVVWRPPFISALVPEERCHLNGLALRDGRPAYATAVSRSDVAAGWRERRVDGGVVVDVAADAVACAGLSMPHSPRWHDGRLWLLNSGTGELGWVDLERGAFVPVAFVPGYGRGLTFHGRYAVVGLSKPRKNRVFTGLPLEERLQEKDAVAQCGLWVIDLEAGHVAHWMQIEGLVEELYDVQVLPGVRRPMALGFKTEEIRRLITFRAGEAVQMHTLAALQEEGRASEAPRPAQRVPVPGAPSPPPPPAPEADGLNGAYTLVEGQASAAEVETHYGSLLFPKLAHYKGKSALHEPLLGVLAGHGESPVGAVVAEARPGAAARVLSFFVARAHRNKGVGTALLARLEDALRRQGAPAVEAAYRTSWPGHGALERVLRKRGWDAPEARRVLIKVAARDIRTAPWLAAADHPLPPPYEVFPWAELGADERAALQQEQARAPFFPAELTPFQLEDRLEPLNSLGLRRDGQVVGWVVTHRLQPDLIQYTSLFVRDGVPKGRIISLLAEAVRRQCTARVPGLLCMIDAENTAMLRFAARRLEPYTAARAEVRVVGKRLG